MVLAFQIGEKSISLTESKLYVFASSGNYMNGQHLNSLSFYSPNFYVHAVETLVLFRPELSKALRSSLMLGNF